MKDVFGKVKTTWKYKPVAQEDLELLKGFFEEEFARKNRQMMQFVVQIDELKREVQYLKSDLEGYSKNFTLRVSSAPLKLVQPHSEIS